MATSDSQPNMINNKSFCGTIFAVNTVSLILKCGKTVADKTTSRGVLERDDGMKMTGATLNRLLRCPCYLTAPYGALLRNRNKAEMTPGQIDGWYPGTAISAL